MVLDRSTASLPGRLIELAGLKAGCQQYSFSRQNGNDVQSGATEPCITFNKPIEPHPSSQLTRPGFGSRPPVVRSRARLTA